jgi:hypothetical protein
MTPQLGSLLHAFTQARRPSPDDLAGAVQTLPALGELPTPWETWTLLGLVRHRRRQLWVGDLVTTRLGGSALDLARMGAFGHPAVPQRGPVPGLPEWEYYFHGKGCCLSHRVTGEEIDVDFFDDSAEYFDLWFYQNHLNSLRTPGLLERWLLSLHASAETLSVAVQDLLAAGALALFPGHQSHPFRISDLVLRHETEITQFCEMWDDPAGHLWLASLIGDWLAAHDEAVRLGDTALAATLAPRAEQCREMRRQRLLQLLPEERFASAALLGLADLGGVGLAHALKEVLEGIPSGLTSTALRIIDRLDDPAWCARVHALFRRVDPSGPTPQPHLWIACLKFLMRHDYQTDTALAALPRATGYEMGEACLLALEYAPDLALPLIRRTLLSRVPANRSAVAAILALIDEPWSRRELLAALEASDDQEQTADCRAALLECHDAEAHRAVRAWEERNPHEPEAPTFVKIGDREFGPCLSFEELMLRDRPQRIRYEMEQLHDRVMRIRDRVPREQTATPPRPWWKVW